MVKVRGIEFEANLDNSMGLEFYNLSTASASSTRTGPIFRT